MPWNSSISTRSAGYSVPATEYNKLVQNLNYLARPVAMASVTSDVSVTGTSFVDVVSLGAVTYENVPHYVEFWCSRIAVGGSGTVTLNFRDASTDLGIIIQPAASAILHGVPWGWEFTPSAASHTYKISAQNQASQTTTINAGAGGAGVRLPLWMRIMRVPT